MTVASLWKALDQASSGQAVGEEDMIDPQRHQVRVNPWTYNQNQRRLQRIEDRPSLAVDLSIWICESLTSTAMNDHNENPALYLVFSRTMKLLSMGIKLVFVIEGKRRIRYSSENDKNDGSGVKKDTFRRRRSGTSFWKACKQCEELLEMLGVQVVRAKAEGEALCALLNLRGIVDGVISNDGDCLLFGAKVVYTKFSIENLEKGCIMRYDASRLCAVAEGRSSDDENDNNKNEKSGGTSVDTVSLSREDLIAFALLTGSDLAGDGLAKVGHKKAVRFIRKCQLDNPLASQCAAIKELESWARAVKPIVVTDENNNDDEGDEADACCDGHEIEETSNASPKKKKKKATCCSRCNHAGSKRSHEKDGCEICGTEPGELCYKQSADDKFRVSLRKKALALKNPKFDPTLVVNAYLRPNDNQLPASLVLAGISSSKTLRMEYPKLRAIVRWPTVVKGQSLKASQDYLKTVVSRLLARTELFQSPSNVAENSNQPGESTGAGAGAQQQRRQCQREKPIPKEIVRKLVQRGIDCYEVCWTMQATITDKDGDGIDGYEFSTVEPQDMVARQHPQLVESFNKAPPKVKKKEGEGEVQKRKAFLESLFQPAEEKETAHRPRNEKEKAHRNFDLTLPAFVHNISGNTSSVRNRKLQLKKYRRTGGGDAEILFRYSSDFVKSKKTDDVERFDFSSLESGSLFDDEDAVDKPIIVSTLKDVASCQPNKDSQMRNREKGSKSQRHKKGQQRRNHLMSPPSKKLREDSHHQGREQPHALSVKRPPCMELLPFQDIGNGHTSRAHVSEQPKKMKQHSHQPGIPCPTTERAWPAQTTGNHFTTATSPVQLASVDPHHSRIITVAHLHDDEVSGIASPPMKAFPPRKPPQKVYSIMDNSDEVDQCYHHGGKALGTHQFDYRVYEHELVMKAAIEGAQKREEKYTRRTHRSYSANQFDYNDLQSNYGTDADIESYQKREEKYTRRTHGSFSVNQFDYSGRQNDSGAEIDTKNHQKREEKFARRAQSRRERIDGTVEGEKMYFDKSQWDHSRLNERPLPIITQSTECAALPFATFEEVDLNSESGNSECELELRFDLESDNGSWVHDNNMVIPGRDFESCRSVVSNHSAFLPQFEVKTGQVLGYDKYETFSAAATHHGHVLETLEQQKSPKWDLNSGEAEEYCLGAFQPQFQETYLPADMDPCDSYFSEDGFQEAHGQIDFFEQSDNPPYAEKTMMHRERCWDDGSDRRHRKGRSSRKVRFSEPVEFQPSDDEGSVLEQEQQLTGDYEPTDNGRERDLTHPLSNPNLYNDDFSQDEKKPCIMEGSGSKGMFLLISPIATRKKHY